MFQCNNFGLFVISNGTTISADTRRDMEFIRLVEENPILYNKTSVSYTNTHKRAAIWTKIALIMNFTGK